MISYEDILSLNFYGYGQPFTGSYKGMRYRILLQKEAKDEEGNVVTEKGLIAVIWPEPYAFEKTDDAYKVTKVFPFTEEGRQALVDWLNASHEQGEWTEGFTLSQLKQLKGK